MEKFGFIYLWRDRKHKRYYLGAHWGNIDDGYLCSSRWMRNSYKRRPKDFKRRILETNIQTRKDMFEAEDKWLGLIKEEELGKRYYNLQKHWKHWSGTPKAKTIGERISIATKEAMWKPEVREKVINSLPSRIKKLHEGVKKAARLRTKEENAIIGKKRWETRKRNGTNIPWNKGLKGVQSHSVESKEKISKRLRGDLNPSKRPEVRIKLISNHWTKTKSFEERNKISMKISENNKRLHREGILGKGMTGKKHFEETKRKISQTKKEIKHENFQTVH